MEDIQFLLSGFLKSLRERHFSMATIRAYSIDLARFERFLTQKKVALQQVDKGLIRHYLGLLRASNFRNASLLRKHASLRSFFTYLARNRKITTNPCRGLSSPRRQSPLPSFLTPDELEKIIVSICRVKNPLAAARNRAWLELVYSSGLRVAETASLNVEDIDFFGGTLRVIGKGNRERIVPLGKPCLAAIRDYLKKRGILIAERSQEARPLFLGLYGKGRLTTRAMHMILKEAAQKAGVSKKVSPHVIRHTFATHMLDAGCDMRTIQEMLGHKNLSTTQIYAHITTERLRKAYEDSHPRS